jgi:hypothetical protein
MLEIGILLTYFHYSDENTADLGDHRVLCVSVYPTLIHLLMPEPISTAFFINPSHQPGCLYVYPLLLLGNGSVKTLPQQWIYIKTIDVLFEASFSIRSVLYERKLSD